MIWSTSANKLQFSLQASMCACACPLYSQGVAQAVQSSAHFKLLPSLLLFVCLVKGEAYPNLNNLQKVVQLSSHVQDHSFQQRQELPGVKNGSCFACRETFSKLHTGSSKAVYQLQLYSPSAWTSFLKKLRTDNCKLKPCAPGASSCFSSWSYRQLGTAPCVPRGLEDNLAVSFSHGVVPYLAKQLSNLQRWDGGKFLGSLLHFIISEKICFCQLKEKLVGISIMKLWQPQLIWKLFSLFL